MAKKFKTVNNWVCQQFITALVNGNYRQCCFLSYNTFNECLYRDMQIRMFQYLFDCISAHCILTLLDSLPLDVRQYINKELTHFYNNREL